MDHQSPPIILDPEARTSSWTGPALSSTSPTTARTSSSPSQGPTQSQTSALTSDSSRSSPQPRPRIEDLLTNSSLHLRTNSPQTLQAIQSKSLCNFDPNNQCGVITNYTPCLLPMTCDIHNLSQKRAVKGRALDFDDLLAAHQACQEAEAGLFSNLNTKIKFDSNNHCGVLTFDIPCRGPLTCTNHDFSQKRAVTGRVLDFEDLLAVHKACQKAEAGLPSFLDTDCSVLVGKLACPGNLICQRHNLAEKRAVEGRSLPYDLLLSKYWNHIALNSAPKTIDLNLHCGVTERVGLTCTNAVVCKIHATEMREKVQGRSLSFKELLIAYECVEDCVEKAYNSLDRRDLDEKKERYIDLGFADFKAHLYYEIAAEGNWVDVRFEDIVPFTFPGMFEHYISVTLCTN
jgi:SCA7, zinc-binding domain